ncbi:hypothetical protein C0993_011951, partial [Termitomyces sp. T159_Od127]
MIPNRWNTRLVAFFCLTFCLLAHGTMHKFGLFLQNALGFSKLLILFVISASGLLCLVGVPGFAIREGYEKPRNLGWNKMWEGSRTDVNSFVTGMYSVIWSCTGYANANYALSEIKDPIRTLKRAAPLAMLFVTIVYIALFFRNLYGPTTEKVLQSFQPLADCLIPLTQALSVLVAFSVLGNLLAGQFAQGRVIQELGREGILPYPSFFASNKPFGAPLAGFFTQYLVSSIGLLLLYTPAYRVWDWNPPFRAPKAIIVLFFLSNLFLVVVPLIPPSNGSRVYEHLPYWLHVFVAYLVSLIGIGY